MAKKVLTKRQLLILETIAKDALIQKNFYLTGGTALAGFYLRHRFSEDLDFFSEQEFDATAISAFFQKTKKELNIKKIDFQQSYNRNLFFLHFSNEVVKTEFTYFPFHEIETPIIKCGIQIDNLIDIAVNKLFSIYQRSVARDYIDLYCIIKDTRWTISELIKKARIKFDFHIDPLQLGAQFIKAETVADLPRMIKRIPEQKWRNFFLKEAEKLKNQILR